VSDTYAKQFAADLVEAAAAFRSKGVTKEITKIATELPPEVAEAFAVFGEAIQALQARVLELESRTAGITEGMKAAQAILKGAA
jgi:hypothetical protein